MAKKQNFKRITTWLNDFATFFFIGCASRLKDLSITRHYFEFQNHSANCLFPWIQEVTVDYYLAEKPYQFELVLVSPCRLANHTGEAPELGSDNGILWIPWLLVWRMKTGDRQITPFLRELLIWLISLHVRKKDCVRRRKKKHRKAQNRDGRTYQKSKVETSLNTKYDLAIITVLYGEEVLKSQFQEMVDKEVAEWVKTV